MIDYETQERHLKMIRAAFMTAAGTFALALFVLLVGCDDPGRSTKAAAAEVQVAAHVQAATPVDAGRYIIKTAGCNDCHTDGFMVDPNIPEEKWLTGSGMGWRGPWGTTYATNLRLWVQPFTEQQFIQMVRGRTGRPPMPWPSMHAMDNADLKAVYAYLKHAGPAGQPTPQYVPPDQEPTTPFVLMVPQMPAGAAAAAK